MTTDPADFKQWPTIRSVLLSVPSQQSRRDDGQGCRCCEDRMSYHASGKNVTKGANGLPITRIHPHLVEHEEGIHLSIYHPDDAGGEKLWHTVKFKDAVKVEFDTMGGKNG